MEPGGNLLTHLVESSIFFRSDCGGRGVCGKCRVEARAKQKQSKTQLACTFTVLEDVSIEIPPTSLLSSLALKNPQALYGDDVMSRISAVGEKTRNLEHLQKLVVKTIEWGCEKLASSNRIAPTTLEKMVVVGNPAMIHLFLGVNPASIGVAPYQPAFFEARCADGSSLGFTGMRLKVHTLPQNGRKYVIYKKSTSGEADEVAISQKDIRSIQFGKAALVTGIEFLLQKENKQLPKKIIVAGAFGSYLEKTDMITLGMFPEMPLQEILHSGNLAGAGAVMALCDNRYLEQAKNLAAQIQIVDLALDIEFQKVFVNRLRFPESQGCFKVEDAL